MKISNSLHQKGSKLNECVQIPLKNKQFQQKMPNFTFYREKQRLLTSATQTPPFRQHMSSSFYDNFQFVDRLTNNKMVYKDARKSSNSLLQLHKISTLKESKHHMNSLLHIYKKTKNFEMNSLKKKIFKKLEAHQEIPIKTQKNLQEVSHQNERKYQKRNSLNGPKQQTSVQVVQRSRKKNKLRSFLDKTVMNMNRAELKRIATENDSIKDEVLQFNQDLTKIKCTMDKNKIDDLLYLREKQQFELGRTCYFKKKQDPIVFKDLTNYRAQSNEDKSNQLKTNNANSGQKNYGKAKRKKISISQQKDKFLERMLIHAKSHLKKEGEYLINPSKETLSRNMLLNKSKKKFILSGYNANTVNTEMDFDMSAFSFEKRHQSSLVSEVKSLVAKQERNQTFTCGGQARKSRNSNNQPKQKDIVYLIKHNYISNAGIQLMANPNACFTKDTKGNNLLHMAIRYERPQVMEMILKKVAYKTCRMLLTQKNNNKRTPLQMAEMIVDRKAIEIIERFIDDNRQRQIMQGWIINGNQS